MTKDKMVGWHHLLNGHESEQALGDGEGQGRETWRAAVHAIIGLQRVGHDRVTKQLQDLYIQWISFLFVELFSLTYLQSGRL